MKYEFTYKVIGYYTISVESDNIDDAIKVADEEITNIDCGELHNIDSTRED